MRVASVNIRLRTGLLWLVIAPMNVVLYLSYSAQARDEHRTWAMVWWLVFAFTWLAFFIEWVSVVLRARRIRKRAWPR